METKSKGRGLDELTHRVVQGESSSKSLERELRTAVGSSGCWTESPTK